MTEAEVLDVIEDIVAKLAQKFSFPGYDPDDIAQEARIMCLDALARYDPATGPLQNFLFAHVRRRLINFKRDHFRRSDAPCAACYRCDQEGRRPDHYDGDFCAKYRAWRTRNNHRVNLTTARGVDADDTRMATSEDASTEVETNEILSLIDRSLDVETRKTWLQMREGMKNIPHEKREKAERVIRRILEKAGVSLPDAV